jgi:hypothetical protein
MVRYYLLATRSLFDCYSIATLIFTALGGGFLKKEFGLEGRSGCLHPTV